MSLTARLTLAMVLLAVATVGMVGLLVYRSLENAILPTELARLQAHAQLQGSRLDELTTRARNDVAAFAASAAFEGIVRARENDGSDPEGGASEKEWRERLARRFVAELNAKSEYHQIRFIGIADAGREIVRVDRSGPNDAVRITPDDELQSKSGSNYFNQTLKLTRGSIYLSEISLNREHGQIEVPYKPQLRVSTLVYTPMGEPFGIFIINVDFRQTLDAINHTEHAGGHVYLVNSEGYYLLDPQPEKTFAFEFGRDDRLQKDFPGLAAELGKTTPTVGFAEGPGGDSIGVALLPLHPGGGPRLALLETVPKAELMAPLALVRNSSLVVASLVVVLAAILALALARSLTQPLVALTRMVESFSVGRSKSIKISASGEIGLLAQAFGKMSRDVVGKTAALHASERRFRALIERSGDGIALIDAQNKILYLSPSVTAIEGYSAEEMIGRSSVNETHPDDLKLVENIVRRLGEHPGVPIPVLWRRKHKDGRWLWLEGVSINLLHDPAVAAIVTNYRDVTARRQTDEALRESEEHFRFLNELGEATRALASADEIMTVMTRMLGEHLGASRCAYAVVEPTTGKFTIPHDYTDGCASIVGFYELSPFGSLATSTLNRGETLVIRNVESEILPGEGAETFRAIGIEAFIVCPLIKLDGFSAMMAVHQTSPRDWLPGEIMIVQEVVERCWSTIERQSAEDEVHRLNIDLERRVVERTSQLEAANKELEAFSYTVSHDLRTPLRAMDGFSQVVLEDFAPLLPAEGQRYLQTIRGSAQRMGKLIDDLLIFARLSRQGLDKQTINTGQLVRSILDELGSPWPERKVEVSIQPLPASVGDPALLKQAWINLLSNALKYTGHREQAEIEIGAVAENDWITYFVRDNGIGFDMKYVHKLFGVFQRLHHIDDYEGTGVGLAIVQRIIHRHGGRIWVDAEEGRGATFYFTLGAGDQS